MEQLGNPGWDPMCFANNQAFTYYLPAMIRLAFEGDYIDQLIFHLLSEERLDALASSKISVIRDALLTLLKTDHERIQYTFDKIELDKLLQKLNQRIK